MGPTSTGLVHVARKHLAALSTRVRTSQLAELHDRRWPDRTRHPPAWPETPRAATAGCCGFLGHIRARDATPVGRRPGASMGASTSGMAVPTSGQGVMVGLWRRSTARSVTDEERLWNREVQQPIAGDALQGAAAPLDGGDPSSHGEAGHRRATPRPRPRQRRRRPAPRCATASSGPRNALHDVDPMPVLLWVSDTHTGW
jgi:hypothetical protein